MAEATITGHPKPVGRRPRLSAGRMGTVALLLVVGPCVLGLPWSIREYDNQRLAENLPLQPPSKQALLGTDALARSMLARCLLGGAISLGIGIASAIISVVIGVAWGACAGYAGGRIDATMMRVVDVLYGLPYILLVVLLDLALKPWVTDRLKALPQLSPDAVTAVADITTLLLAIGGLSWLTMARVIRGQVLSLRARPFIEAARASGARPVRIFFHHLLPNLAGPIVVYATLTVPVAILQESFLSFLGIGVQLPLPSWGNLASEGMAQIHAISQRWWLLLWPCLLLGITLMALNFLGESLRQSVQGRA